MILLFAKTAHTMNGMIQVVTSDKKTFEIEERAACLFSTLRDHIDNDGGSLHLPEVSSKAWKKLIQDMPRIVDFYKRADENTNDAIARILSLQLIDRKDAIKDLLIDRSVPPCSPPPLIHAIEDLKTAYCLQFPELIQLYASTVAWLSLSDASLKQLHANPSQHPLINIALPDDLKNEIYGYFPEVWFKRITIESYTFNDFIEAFSTDGKYIKTYYGLHTEHITEMKTGKMLHEVKGASFVPAESFRHCPRDQIIRSEKSGKPLESLFRPQYALPDGKIIFTSTSGNYVGIDIHERVDYTLGQGLLVQLVQWCSKNKMPINCCDEWIVSAYETYKYKFIIHHLINQANVQAASHASINRRNLCALEVLSRF